MAKINTILSEVLDEIRVPAKKLRDIKGIVDEFVNKLNKKIKNKRILAEVFVGGSFAKKTMIKKKIYDIDIFIRYNKRYKNNELSKITEILLSGIEDMRRIHGSRDYFQVKITEDVILEIIPVRLLKNINEIENVTDLSYSHVKYIKKKVGGDKRLIDEILLTKAFCYANNCYGAESYIRGFSGYSLELLICYYRSFFRLIKALSNLGPDEKKVIDIEKKYKSGLEVFMNINSAKLQSPLILIDPTYKQRNVLAGLSHETFTKFKIACKKFLRNPSKNMFLNKGTNFPYLIRNSKKRGEDYVLIKIQTNKRDENVAGGKLLKFHNRLLEEIGRFYDVKKKEFEYNQGNSAICFFSVVKKKVIKKGPEVSDEKNAQRFKEKHKHVFVKEGRLFCEEEMNLRLKKFLETWAEKYKAHMKEMYINKLKILEPSD